MYEPDYETIEKEMRGQPDSYFLGKISEEFKNLKASDVPHLIDIANICFDSSEEKEGLSFRLISIYVETLGKLHGQYIQSARQAVRPPLERKVMIDKAYWYLKRERMRMSEEFNSQDATDVPHLLDLANICLDNYYEKDTLSFYFIAKFIEILGKLYEDYIKSAKENDRPSLDRQAMIDRAHWLLKREQCISGSMLRLSLSYLED